MEKQLQKVHQSLGLDAFQASDAIASWPEMYQLIAIPICKDFFQSHLQTGTQNDQH